MLQGAQPSVGVGTEPHPLGGGAAVAGEGEHLTPGHDHADRALQDRRGHDGGDLVGADALAAEAAADVLGADPHRARVEGEEVGEFALDPHGALVGVEHVEPAAVPVGRHRVRLHRVVVFLGGGVLGVHDDGGGGEFGLQVALLDHRGAEGVQRVRVRGPGGEVDVVRLLFVVHDQRLRRLPGLLGGLGDDQRHGPAPVRYPVVLEDGGGRVGLGSHEARVVGVEARGVLVGQDGEHARHREGVGGLDRADPAAGHRGQREPAVDESGEGDLPGVAGGAGDLVAAFDAGARGADGALVCRGGGGHRAASSVSSDRTATTRLRMRVTL